MKFILISILLLFYSCSNPTEAEKLMDLVKASNKVDPDTDVAIVDTINSEDIDVVLTSIDSVMLKLDSQLAKTPEMLEGLKESLEENEKMLNGKIHKILIPIISQTILELKQTITSTEQRLSINQDKLKDIKAKKEFFFNAMKNIKDTDVFYVVKGKKDGAVVMHYLNTAYEFVDYPL